MSRAWSELPAQIAATGIMPPFVFERFKKYVKTGRLATDCWEWTGQKTRGGYGQLGRVGGNEGGRNIYAHRLSYGHFLRPIPPGKQLDHLCRNRSCVNPSHLEPVTAKENVARGLGAPRVICKNGHSMAEHGYVVRGEKGRKCRECVRAGMKRRYATHGEAIRAKNKAYYAANKEPYKRQAKAWYQENKERALYLARLRYAAKKLIE